MLGLNENASHSGPPRSAAKSIMVLGMALSLYLVPTQGLLAQSQAASATSSQSTNAGKTSATSPIDEFDAISLKPYQSSRPLGPSEFSADRVAAASLRGGPGTADPGLITATGITLRELVAAAYGMLSEQVSGPPWIADSTYALAAKVPPLATKAQARLMLQRSLLDRFKLSLHRDQKQFQVWELVIATTPPRLKETADQDAAPKMSSQAREGIRHDTYRAFRISKTDSNDSSVSLDRVLSLYLAATGMVSVGTLPSVVDKTGLTKSYDFDLEYVSPAARDRVDVIGPTLFKALEKQLGLKLQQKKTTLVVLVIDHAEKAPTEN
jgi:uncharacterized protein (TIGR03435 family)